MKTSTKSIFLALLLLVITCPPWNIRWVEETQAAVRPPQVYETEFAGFHFIVNYTPAKATRTIAWDGVGTGGKIFMRAMPVIHIKVWIAELVAWALAYGIAHKMASRPKRRPHDSAKD